MKSVNANDLRRLQIAKLRAVGMTQADISQRLEISQQSVSYQLLKLRAQADIAGAETLFQALVLENNHHIDTEQINFFRSSELKEVTASSEQWHDFGDGKSFNDTLNEQYLISYRKKVDSINQKNVDSINQIHQGLEKMLDALKKENKKFIKLHGGELNE